MWHDLRLQFLFHFLEFFLGHVALTLAQTLQFLT